MKYIDFVQCNIILNKIHNVDTRNSSIILVIPVVVFKIMNIILFVEFILTSEVIFIRIRSKSIGLIISSLLRKYELFHYKLQFTHDIIYSQCM